MVTLVAFCGQVRSDRFQQGANQRACRQCCHRDMHDMVMQTIYKLLHCPTSTATTHIGSCCACSFGLVLVNGSASKAVPVSYPKAIIPSRCRHCDGEVVIHTTNDHLVLITHLLSLSKIRALLRAFYTMRYIDNAKGWLYF